MTDYHFERDHADDSVLRPVLLALAGLVVFGTLLIVVSFLAAHAFA
jgi:hypothetical protein